MDLVMRNQYPLQCTCMENGAKALVTILDLSLLHDIMV